MDLGGYPRFITPGFKPFDPVKLAKWTEKIVTRYRKGRCERKYTAFYATGVYGGIATGYTVGCCLRCYFCWVDWSRDFPEKYGRFYSPEEVFRRLKDAAHRYGVNKLRISGAEPTIGKDHLLSLLELIEGSEFPLFILETNGILFGVDKDYVRRISKFTKVYVRISLKAGTPEAFTKKTGAIPESFEIPFKAIENLLDYNVRFHVAAMSADPRIMSAEERISLFKRLAEIDKNLLLTLEEEVVDPYNTTLARLEYAGIRLKWPLKEIYVPIKDILSREKSD
ncbi:molybdenum cofactor biosynthesis protein MoaA [Candidatus Geothermarchaeota archaeon]|nr:MAG: molybdenum cofactor biosynthesis protein MoaA [Candidatus Geothermarchaeota archaeon]